MGKKKLGILVGSLRRDSYSRKVAVYLSSQLEEQFDVEIMDISTLAMYNQDLDDDNQAPQEWLRFREGVKAKDAVLFVTPEYNRSMPAVLKNALDVASRPYVANVWSGKPGAVVSVSPGRTGGFGACHHLRQTATCLNIYLMQRPETYISGIDTAVDENGVTDARIQGTLQQFAQAFTEWVGKFTG